MTDTARETGPRPCLKPHCNGITRILAPARGYIREYCPECQDIISSWPAPGNPRLKRATGRSGGQPARRRRA